MAKKQILQQGGDGTAVPTGMVGETITTGPTESLGASSSGVTLGTLPLTKGKWLVSVSGSIIVSSPAVTNAAWAIRLTTNATLNPSNSDCYNNIGDSIGGNASVQESTVLRGHASGNFIITITNDTTYYLRGAYTAVGGGSIGIKGLAIATRLA
jgi:hypothetical protein